MPFQPEGIWQSEYNDAKWQISEGEDRYRRAIYTFSKRTSGYPSFIAFDAPSREVCTLRRITTNTPLQALVTMNDPVYIECARQLASRMLNQGGATDAERIAWGHEVATGRPIPDGQSQPLIELCERARAQFREEPQTAQPLSTDESHFAMTAVANALLNLDATLTK
jgi:hypothetical protein